MALDMGPLEPHPRVVRLTGALDGFEIQIKHVGMRERDRWRKAMIREGIMNKDGTDTNPGRLSDFVRSHVETFVIGWTVPERFRSVDAKDVNPPFSAEQLATLLDASPDSFSELVRAATEEAAFFNGNGGGSPTK